MDNPETTEGLKRLKERISELEKENGWLRQERKDIYYNNLMAAFAYRSQDFDTTREDFLYLAGARPRGDCFFVVTFCERRKDGRIMEFDSEGNIISRGRGPSYQDMRDIILQSFAPRHILFPAFTNGQIACIVNYQPMPGSDAVVEDEAEKELEGVMETINAKMKCDFGFAFLISVSRAHYGAKNVSSATRDCMLLDEYRGLLEEPEQEIMLYSWFRNINGSAHGGLLSSDSVCFVRHVHNRDYTAARDVLNEKLLPRLLGEPDSVAAFKLSLFRFTDFFIRTVLENGELPQEERAQSVEYLLRGGAISELVDEMNRILTWLAGNSRIRAKYLTNLAERLKKHIELSYMNADTDVNAIAEHFNISPTYAAKVYKIRYGVNISYDLQKCRVEASKGLLAEGLSIKGIAESVGFGNSSNMIRIYKKFEGETPGRSAVPH